jgi:hypothetical protein
LSHKDLKVLQEPAIHRKYALAISPHGRTASRCNIFARVARESDMNEVHFMFKPKSLSRANRAKMLAGGRPYGSSEATLVQCKSCKVCFFEVFVVRFSSNAAQQQFPTERCMAEFLPIQGWDMIGIKDNPLWD